MSKPQTLNIQSIVHTRRKGECHWYFTLGWTGYQSQLPCGDTKIMPISSTLYLFAKMSVARTKRALVRDLFFFFRYVRRRYTGHFLRGVLYNSPLRVRAAASSVEKLVLLCASQTSGYARIKPRAAFVKTSHWNMRFERVAASVAFKLAAERNDSFQTTSPLHRIRISGP